MAHDTLGNLLKLLSFLLIFASASSISPIALADPLSGTKTVKLVQEDNTSLIVATIEFTPSGEFSRYELRWDDEKFADHFLSMRPFKCLEGDVKYWCQVPYPYEIRKTVSAADLTDLEYELLFVWKGSTEYGINMWNGIYYKLELEADRIVGVIHEMDMDELSAPPEKGNLRPVREQDLEPGEASSHWLPKIVIE